MRPAVLEFMREAVDRPNEALLCFGEPGVGERLLRDLEAHMGHEFTADRRAGRIMVGEAHSDVDQQLENFIAPLEEAGVIADRIRRKIMTTKFPHGASQPTGMVTASIGLSSLSPALNSAEASTGTAWKTCGEIRSQGASRQARPETIATPTRT